MVASILEKWVLLRSSLFMVVRISFYSYFKDLAGCGETSATLPAASTIDDLLTALEPRFPKLRPMRKSILVAVGVDYQTRNYGLKDGDEVSLFPPVQGG
jgi:molybdopterin converting factor small subunit